MERKAVTSSAVVSVGHENGVLEVEMKGGRVYRHEGVSADDHAKLIGSDSIGRHYGQFIKGAFPGVRVKDPQTEKALGDTELI